MEHKGYVIKVSKFNKNGKFEIFNGEEKIYEESDVYNGGVDEEYLFSIAKQYVDGLK